jgi:hypothetical protein
MRDDAVGWLLLLGLLVLGVILRLEAALAALRRPRSLSWGRGRWRLVAWGQVRLSPIARSLLAMGLTGLLVAGAVYWIEAIVTHIPLVCVLAGSLGILAALWGMGRAWRSGERHRWAERWSERPQDEITGLVPRSPAAPAVAGPPSPTAAIRVKRPR